MIVFLHLLLLNSFVPNVLSSGRGGDLVRFAAGAGTLCRPAEIRRERVAACMIGDFIGHAGSEPRLAVAAKMLKFLIDDN